MKPQSQTERLGSSTIIYQKVSTKIKNPSVEATASFYRQTTSKHQIPISTSNLSLDMKLKAIEFVQLKFSQYRKQDMQDMTLARELKMNFDENFHPTWQCVVGRNYGTEIGFEDGYVIYFYVGSTAILLWKAG